MVYAVQQNTFRKPKCDKEGLMIAYLSTTQRIILKHVTQYNAQLGILYNNYIIKITPLK